MTASLSGFCWRCLLLVAFLMGMVRIATAGDASSLPVKVDADVVECSGVSWLRVKVVNISTGNIAIRKDLGAGACWSVHFSGKRNGRSIYGGAGQSSSRISCISGSKLTPNGKRERIRHLLSAPGNALWIQPGDFHEFMAPLEKALRMVTSDTLTDASIDAVLEFKNVILSSPDADDAETIRLYEEKLRTPRFAFKDGVWKPSP